ncbi:MAG TPA: M1 family metallopeptidase, partial [Myxococcaceae bacterium]|nr:M1 family metallopeptidase [Myxococcaceae bacterium]
AKGSAVLAMFESSVGPERFREGVRAYMRRHAQGNTTAADFFRALSEAAGTDVTPALSTFVDQPGIPLVSMELRCAADAPPALTLAQRRYLPVGAPSARAQTWQVPVCVRYGTGGHEGRACTTLTGDTGALVLEDARGCPDWLVPNADARGYYHAKLDGALLRKLTRDGGKRLTLAEQMGLLADAQALVASGDLPVEEALTLVTRLLPSEDKDLLTGALQVVGSVRPDFIPDALEPRYASFVRRTFGDKARALGFHPRPGEDEATRLLRPTLVRQVALRGKDEKLRAEARQLALRWLDDRRAVSPEMVDVVLQVAARQGGASLHQRLLTAARETKDSTERQQLLHALGSFHEPALAQASLALLLSEDFTILDSLQGIGAGMLFEPATRGLAYAYMKENLDAIVARLPHEATGFMLQMGAGFCDTEHRQDVEAFFKDRAPKYPGGTIYFARVLEGVDLCIAQRELVQPSVTRFLSRK